MGFIPEFARNYVMTENPFIAAISVGAAFVTSVAAAQN